MFTAQHVELARRKERLIAQAQRDRESIAALGTRLERPFALADKAVEAGHYLKAHPWIAVATAASAGIMGRRRLWRAAGWGWTLFRTWRVVSPWLRAGFNKNNF